MKKASIILIALLIFQFNSFSQSCLPEGITFISQAQVDSFQINYPGCSIIEGDLIIGPENSWNEIDINNLDSLIVLTSIEGNLKVWNNDVLANLIGLDSLSSIGADLIIETNSSIESLLGLEALTTIGGELKIYGGNYITSLNGIDNVSSIGSGISISYSNALTDISSLSNLLSINGDITIFSNATLTSLLGLGNIDAATISSLSISNNPLLSYCEVQSICNYLVLENTTVDINNNASGCDSESEVNTACSALSVSELELEFSIYPNPAEDVVFISSSSEKEINEVFIYNQAGKKVINEKYNGNGIDISSLSPGIYILEVTSGHSKYREKLLVK